MASIALIQWPGLSTAVGMGVLFYFDKEAKARRASVAFIVATLLVPNVLFVLAIQVSVASWLFFSVSNVSNLAPSLRKV